MKKLFLLLLTGLVLPLNAQFMDLLKDKVKDKAAGMAGEKMINAITTEAITTNFKDCNTSDIKDPAFASDRKFTSLCNASFTDEGYLLKPGFYEINVKSFCLKAGTYAPSKGDGYLYAPLKGPKEEIIDRLVKNWYRKPSVEQSKVQSLIWAIIAKTSFKNMNNDMKVTAAQLLTEKDVLNLSKMGLDFVPDNIMSKAKSKLPPAAQSVIEAENKIRNFFASSGSSSYADLERIAMLAGVNPETSTTQRGTWGLHPKGFWVAYLPNGYKHMKVRIYVPETLASVYYLPSEDVAVPANTSSQRLMVSDVLDCNENFN